MKLGLFDEIIDARTPEEFSKDIIHGAVNITALTNEEKLCNLIKILQYKFDPYYKVRNDYSPQHISTSTRVGSDMSIGRIPPYPTTSHRNVSPCSTLF